jgi:magnesium-transporting ATPase (P-type)
MFCEQCGKEIKSGVKFCENCGWAIPAAPVPPAAMPTTMPNSQNVPAGKKSNIVFLVFSILCTVVGIIIFINALFVYQRSYISGLSSSGSSWDDYDSHKGAAYYACQPFLIAIGVMTMGVLSSIISLYRKPNKLYFWISISPCILLAILIAFFGSVLLNGL